MSETFITQLIEAGRVTIPKLTREVLKLKTGCKVRVTLEKIEEC